MNTIHSHIPQPVTYRMFADDLCISLESNDAPSAEKILQITVNSLQNWSSKTGFRFSSDKTYIVDFNRKHKKSTTPSIRIRESTLQPRSESTFLGLVFDQRLKWTKHITKLKLTCSRAMNVIKYLNGKNGLDSHKLLSIYRTLIRSKLDYGSQV